MSFQKIKSSTSRCFDISTAALHIIAMLFMLMDHQLFCLKIEKVKSYMLMISFIKNIHNLKIIRKQLLAKLILICLQWTNPDMDYRR